MDCDTSSKTCRSAPSTQTPTHLDCHHHREHIFGISPSLSPQRKPTPAPCPPSALPTPPQNEPFQHSIVSDGTSFALVRAYIGNCACGIKNQCGQTDIKGICQAVCNSEYQLGEVCSIMESGRWYILQEHASFVPRPCPLMQQVYNVGWTPVTHLCAIQQCTTTCPSWVCGTLCDGMFLSSPKQARFYSRFQNDRQFLRPYTISTCTLSASIPIRH